MLISSYPLASSVKLSKLSHQFQTKHNQFALLLRIEKRLKLKRHSSAKTGISLHIAEKLIDPNLMPNSIEEKNKLLTKFLY